LTVVTLEPIRRRNHFKAVVRTKAHTLPAVVTKYRFIGFDVHVNRIHRTGRAAGPAVNAFRQLDLRATAFSLP
jgi:hypothetical protein